MSKMDKYPDLKARLRNSIEVNGGAVTALSAVITLAELLHDKGLIEYEEFIDSFYADLEKED